AGKGAVVGEFTQVIAAGKVEDFFLDEGEVGGVAGRRGQKSLITPDIIRHAVAPHAADDIVFGDKEPADDDPFVGQRAEFIVERRWKHQHEGGEVVDAGKVQSTVAFAPKQLLLQFFQLVLDDAPVSGNR